jgi:hypothetical protein
MQKVILWAAILVVVVVGGFWALNSYIYNEKQAAGPTSHRDAEYLIEGEWLTIDSGLNFFGNELYTDLDADGREDVVFVVTHQAGGSGTFYYAVGALNTERGYLGSDGYFLGDRIAPQTTEVSQNPRHRNVVVINYADRAPGEPMVAAPSVGKSVYLKLDPNSRQWGIVLPDFEGESNL